jgi:hypothetical protein
MRNVGMWRDLDDDLRSSITGEPGEREVDEAIRILSAEIRLRKKAAEIRGNAKLMAAVRERAKELVRSDRGRTDSEDEE